MKKQCPICGAENMEQAQFCKYCGVKIGEDPEIAETAENTEEAAAAVIPEVEPDGEAPSIKEKISVFLKENRTKVTFALLGVLVLAAILSIVVLVRSFDDSNTGHDSAKDTAALESELASLETWYVTNAGSALQVYNDANAEAEVIGELHNGDPVKVKIKNGDYWYIYATQLGSFGYVDKTNLVADRRAVVSGEDVAVEDLPVGSGSAPQKYEFVRYVYVSNGSLALREAPSADAEPLGELYNYNAVYVVNSTSFGNYWYAYSPNLKMYGYVNSSYLIGAQKPPKKEEEEDDEDDKSDVYYVSVSKGYLALRSAQSFDASNEIGKLYNGDQVQVKKRSGTYWYVYAPSLGISGYVNSSYLTKR